MSHYVTPEEVMARYRVFATNSLSHITSDAIFYASKEVESRLAKAFTVPFSEAYPTVKDLTIELCYVRYKSAIEPKLGDQLRKRLDARFANILSGVEGLITNSGFIAPSKISDADLPESTTQDYYPVHSMLGAENEYTQVDPDRLDDLEDERSDS